MVISVPLNRVSSPATRGLNWLSSARKTVSSGGRRIFQAGGSALCKRAAAAEKFRLIDSRIGRFPVSWLLRQQNPGCRARENAVLTAKVKAVFERHRGYYGAPRVHQELRATGLKVGHHRVARLMRCSALTAKTRRGFRPCRNSATKTAGVAENLLQQEFSPTAPNRFWAGDITYIRTTAGWRYQAVWIDLYSRRVVGWAMGASMEARLVLEALNRALGHRQIEADQLLVHTDQGGQYRATAYRQLLASHQIRSSMSAKGCCVDNAVVESFFSTLVVWRSGSMVTTTVSVVTQRSVTSARSITNSSSSLPVNSNP